MFGSLATYIMALTLGFVDVSYSDSQELSRWVELWQVCVWGEFVNALLGCVPHLFIYFPASSGKRIN